VKIALIVPTLNAGHIWKEWIEALRQQTLKADVELIIDSDSNDETVQQAESAKIAVHKIKRVDFNHGATRQLGVQLAPDADVLIFLTQDAILAHPKSIELIVAAFQDPGVGVAYGRQLPHKEAKPIEAHARLFNYPGVSKIKTFDDRAALGIKTIFISNSFAAYRGVALEEVGGFPANVILGEDTFVATKMVMKGWKIAYCADAQVYHSHDYTLLQEFCRYFDVGAFHVQEPWIQAEFGGARGEGMRYLTSELKYLIKVNFLLIPMALMRTGVKLLGYRLGKLEGFLAKSVKRKLSMHKNYWQ
jgi:rhamnosyltransferase